MKRLTAEHITWLSLITAALVIIVVFPWQVAAVILPYLTWILVICLAFWYIRIRKIYLETHSERGKIRSELKKKQQAHGVISKILAHSPDGILVLDEERRISYISPSLERISGWRKEEVLGRLTNQVFKFEKNGEDKPIPELIFENKHQPVSLIAKNLMTNKKGDQFEIEAHCMLIHNPESDEYEGLAMIRKQ